MDQDAVAQLAMAIERSIDLRQSLLTKLAAGAAVDVVEEWEAIERLDHEISRMIRKRAPD